jgi:hypothetical protein
MPDSDWLFFPFKNFRPEKVAQGSEYSSIKQLALAVTECWLLWTDASAFCQLL